MDDNDKLEVMTLRQALDHFGGEKDAAIMLEWDVFAHELDELIRAVERVAITNAPKTQAHRLDGQAVRKIVEVKDSEPVWRQETYVRARGAAERRAAALWAALSSGRFALEIWTGIKTYELPPNNDPEICELLVSEPIDEDVVHRESDGFGFIVQCRENNGLSAPFRPISFGVSIVQELGGATVKIRVVPRAHVDRHERLSMQLVPAAKKLLISEMVQNSVGGPSRQYRKGGRPRHHARDLIFQLFDRFEEDNGRAVKGDPKASSSKKIDYVFDELVRRKEIISRDTIKKYEREHRETRDEG